MRNSRQVMRMVLAALLTAASLVLIPSSAVRAATSHVTTCAGSGPGSLADAASTAGLGSTIVFDLDCPASGPIIFSSHIFLISGQVTIDATGHTIVLDGNHTTQMFLIGGTGTVTITGVTFQNGADFDGGAIFNGGTLTINGSTFVNNTAANGNGGGAILNGLSLTVNSSTFVGNQATPTNTSHGGGAIANCGSLSVNNSTIAGNTVTGVGGGIANYCFGSTMHSTQSIIAGNTATGSGQDVSADPANDPVMSGGHNLVGNASGIGGFTGPGDLTNSNPRLGPLGDNGGTTKTAALMPGSPAIDAGGASCPATDQRGIARPQPASGACDIGAFEYVPVMPTIGTVAPATSSMAGRPGVVISGTGFQTGSQVAFGGINAPVTAVAADGTSLTVSAPPQASPGTVSIMVTNPGGLSATKPNAFTYDPPPAVTTVAPAIGQAGATTAVAISGTGFQAGAAVQFGGVAAGNVTVVNGTTVTATAPAQPQGTVNVTVVNPDGGTSTLTNGFTYMTLTPLPVSRAVPASSQPPPDPTPRSVPTGTDPVQPLPTHR